MARPSRLIVTTLLLVVSTAVGAFAFDLIRKSPRCTIRAPHRLMHVSADGKWAITHRATYEGQETGPICVWDTRNGEAVASFLADATYVRWAMSPDETWLAVSPHSGELVYLIDWRRGVMVPIRLDGAMSVYQFIFSTTGRWCVVQSQTRGGTSALIDVANRRLARMFSNDVRISDDERFLVQLDEAQQRIEVWNLARLQKVTDLATKFNEVVLAPKGRWLASWYMYCDRSINDYDASLRDGGLTVWDLTSGRLQHRLEPVTRKRQIVFDCDGRRMATWSGDTGRLELVELESGRTKHVATGKNSRIQFTDSTDLLCHWDWAEKKVLMHHAATGDLMWQMLATAPGRSDGRVGLTLGPECALRIDRDRPVMALLDLDSGRELHSLDIGMLAFPCPTYSKNRQFMVLSRWESQLPYSVDRWLGRCCAEPQAVVVAMSHDPTKCSVAFRLYHAEGRGIFNASISDDGSTLVVHQRQIEPMPGASEKVQQLLIINVWDVGSRRAWTWAIAAAALTALVFSVVGRTWQRRTIVVEIFKALTRARKEKSQFLR